MSVSAADILAALPPDRRVGSAHVLEVQTMSDVDSQGEDALRVTLILAAPAGPTWNARDVSDLRLLIRRALVELEEDRSIVFMIQVEDDPNAVDDVPPPRFGS